MGLAAHAGGAHRSPPTHAVRLGQRAVAREEMVENHDDVGEVENRVAVDVAGAPAGGRRALAEEVLEEVNGVSDVHAAVGVAVAAHEGGAEIEDQPLLSGRRVGRTLLDDDGVVAIEWAEKFISLLPKPLLLVEIHIANEDERDIEIREVADEKGSTNESCPSAGAFDHIFERLKSGA